MFKKVLFAAALLMAISPAAVSAQDFFFSFDEFSRVPTTTSGATGSVFIFADAGLDFNQLDLDFTNDNPSVVSFTGGVVFNDFAPLSGTASSAPGGAFTSFDLLDPTGATSGVTATDGRLFATSFLSPGQQPGSGASNFRAGANGFLLAQIDYDIVGEGTANFDFIAGDLGVVNDGVGQVPVTFGTGSLTVEGVVVCAGYGPFPYCDIYPEPEPEPEPDPSGNVPEPSSAVLLILGGAAIVARRKRS